MVRRALVAVGSEIVHDPRIERVVESGCWVWMGSANPAGYGLAKVDGRTTGAHRVVWEQVRGPIPPGMVIDHICRVRCCVNPDHLRVVTPRVNALENSISPAAKHSQKTACSVCGGAYRKRVNGARRCGVCRVTQNREAKRRQRARDAQWRNNG